MSDRRQQENGSSGEEEQGGGRTTVEWVTLGISTLIVAGLAGLIIYLYVSGGSMPAIIEVRPQLDQVRVAQNRYYVPVEVTNEGSQTAQAVTVEGVLTTADGATETSEVTINFLAGRATANATLVFRQDPSRGELMVDVVSYLEP